MAALEADQARINIARQVEHDSANQLLKEIEEQERQVYQDLKSGLIEEVLRRSVRGKWSSEELALRAMVESTSTPLASNIDSVRKTIELAQVA